MNPSARLLSVLTLLLPSVSPVFAQEKAEVRVIFNANRILDIHAQGVADRATGRAVTLDDPVRVASISKLYVALGVLRLVDKGKLDLDRDVSDYLGWKLRNPAFPEKAITLRLLLSHQSSLSDEADYLIPVDQTIRSRLDDSKAWDGAHAPGSGWFHYTNLNFPVIASVMEAATGERFDGLIDRLVLKPLKLEACFNWSTCTAEQAKHAVVLYRATGEVAKDDLKGTLPDCPGVAASDGGCDLSHYVPGDNGAIFSPQGGLRISARDLAKTGQMLMRGGKGFLSRESFKMLVGPEWRYNGHNGVGEDGLSATGFFCAYGLAMHSIGTGVAGCRDDPFGDGAMRIGHAGEAYGLKSGLWIDPKSNRGVAFFTTAVPENEPRGKSGFYVIEERLLHIHNSQKRN